MRASHPLFFMPKFDEPNVRLDDPLIRFDDPRTYQEILNQQLHPAMFKVAVDISNITPLKLIDRATAISAGTAGRAVFASLEPKLAALNTLIGTFAPKQAAIATTAAIAKTAVTQRDAVVTAIIAAVNEIGIEVGKLATSEEDVTATTMHVVGSKPPAPKVAPDKPDGLAITVGDHPGAISGHCHGQPGIVDYWEIRLTTTDPTAPTTTWPFNETSPKSSFEMDGLPSGQIVWGEMRACNNHGKSPWSDPASVRVP
jgi:hypothetical protein